MDKGKLCLGAGLGGVMLAIALVAFLSPPPEKEQLFDRSEAHVEGMIATDEIMPPDMAERVIRLVAHHVGATVHSSSPRLSAELPEGGERFEGLVPPIVAAPSFSIRKPAAKIFTLADYVAASVMTADQAAVLEAAVVSRANILVAGGTGTGKTTLVNALLAEIAKSDDRVILIEDTRELQCSAPNLVALRTKDGAATLRDLVRCALRLALPPDAR